jgi:hypothetical protein
MNRVVITYILLAVTACCAVACESSREERTAVKSESVASVTTDQLPLPSLPATLADPKSRATYIVSHFWDAMDFNDTVRSHDPEFMEQNFVNYLSLFSLVDDTDLAQSIASLLHKASTDTAAYSLTARIAYKYLYEPNSPMLNEDYYALFLRPLISDRSIDDAQRARYRYYLESINRNRPGSPAADFAYIDRNGKVNTLRNTTAASQFMIIFFDPDCDHCKAVISLLANSEGINNLINRGELTILAVYAEGDMDAWKKSDTHIPDNWIAGYDKSGIEDNDIYTLRAMPTIYLLNKDKNVILKDVLVNKVMDVLL